MEEEGINQDLLKVVLLLVTLPLWGPFLRAMWQELRHSLRPEGGLFGPVPSPRQRRAIEQEMAGEERHQVHEPVAHHRSRRSTPGGAARRARGPLPGGAPRGGPGRQPFGPSPRRRGPRGNGRPRFR